MSKNKGGLHSNFFLLGFFNHPTIKASFDSDNCTLYKTQKPAVTF